MVISWSKIRRFYPFSAVDDMLKVVIIIAIFNMALTSSL